MILEDRLNSWTGPSSDTEQDKQDRTERMIREAVANHALLSNCSLTVYAKGSYANKTNVRADSDVDIAVQCHEAEYWDEAVDGAHPPAARYEGPWTPAKLRTELGAALHAKFPGQVDDSGSTAFKIASSSARVDADVVPCFDYRYYSAGGGSREGAKIFLKDGRSLVNYPAQQLVNGNAKNTATANLYKRAVRVLKRVENVMLADGVHREVPSFFIECLVYNCPNEIIRRSSWTDRIGGILVHIWENLQGDEPAEESGRWLEVNECKYLFHPGQKWTRADGRDLAYAAWNHLGYSS